MKRHDHNYFLKYQLFITTFSLFFWVYLLGLKNINPTNVEWLYLPGIGDISTYQIGWQFFRIDEWRFPIGLNPNFGIYLNNSIVFSDSIPFLAVFFKIFNHILPDNFQYFSLWILVCIYFQVFFAFKIIYQLTNDLFYSLVGALFFCFATIFIHRSGIHLSLFGQWIILSYFYIETLNKNNIFFYKCLNILFSITIHFYFTLILSLLFFLENIFDYLNKKKVIKKVFLDFFILFFSAIFLMYILGYFSINVDDSLGWGYGYYNFNLNSFFNPLGQTNFINFSWSSFFKVQKFQNGEMEGFSYLGISGIIFFMIYLFNSIYKKDKIIYSNYQIILISIFFTVLATSNNINIGGLNLIKIPVNDFLYIFLSIVRASGRLIWPIYYLIFIIGIVFIYKNFNKKKAYIIILILFCLQILDISSGLTNYKFGKQFNKKESNLLLKSDVWDNLSINHENIRLLEPRNQSKINILSEIFNKEKFLKTDIVNLARINRQLVVNEKYKLNNLFNQTNLEIFDKTIFISDNIDAVKYIHYRYLNNLNYYFRDNLWLISKNKIKDNVMDDSLILSHHYEHNLDKAKLISFDNNVSVSGIGIERKPNVTGLIFDGFQSTILMKFTGNDCSKKSKLKLRINKFYQEKKGSIKIALKINQLEKQELVIDEYNNELLVNFNCIKGKLISLLFEIDEPESSFDRKSGLNRKKRSVILESILFVN